MFDPQVVDAANPEQFDEPGVVMVQVSQSWSKKQLRSRILKLLR